MDFTVSLKKNHEFRRLYNKGKNTASQFVAVYSMKNGKNINRLGITVSAKIGGAVQRNRIRRRLKEIYRINEQRIISGYDIVIVARMRCVDSDYKELETSLTGVLKRMSLMHNDIT